MKRTKQVTYNSCDLCDSEEEAVGRCDVCGKYLCGVHNRHFPWADQRYQFCSEHLNVVLKIIEKTGISIGFVVSKLKRRSFSEYERLMWDERGYEGLWNGAIEKELEG